MNWFLVIGLGVASALDWRFRRVPNGLTMSLALTGIIIQVIRQGISGLEESVLGLLVGISLLYLPFLLGGVGGGDVKLMGAIGAFVGPLTVMKVFLAGVIFGGVFSLIEISRRRLWQSTFENLRNRILHLILTKKWASESEVNFSSHAARIPYAIAISCGYLWVYFFGGG